MTLKELHIRGIMRLSVRCSLWKKTLKNNSTTEVGKAISVATDTQMRYYWDDLYVPERIVSTVASHLHSSQQKKKKKMKRCC